MWFWPILLAFILFFFNDTATTEIYTLSLHDALPILDRSGPDDRDFDHDIVKTFRFHARSEEHTSELQSRPHLVCRLLLEKKKPSCSMGCRPLFRHRIAWALSALPPAPFSSRPLSAIS